MRMRGIAATTLVAGLTLSFTGSTLNAANRAPTEEIHLEEALVERLMVQAEKHFRLQALAEHRATSTPTVSNLLNTLSGEAGFFADDVIRPDIPGLDDGFDDQPSDDPLDFELPSFGRKSGAAEIIAIETLRQTLLFYGVIHTFKKSGARTEFKVLQSRNGHFTDLTRLDVASAIREFSRYLTALLCNEPTIENFYRVFSQVAEEEIGLRFKYDMAFALLGNSLPKEPNMVFALGTRWKTLSRVISTLNGLTGKNEERDAELNQWSGTISSVISLLTQLNKLSCFVDIRPEPREEIRKRVVNKKLLDLKKRNLEYYAQFEDILRQVDAEARKAQLESLR